MAAIDIEVIPDKESFPDSNPHNLESELVDMDDRTMSDKDPSSSDVSMDQNDGMIESTFPDSISASIKLCIVCGVWTSIVMVTAVLIVYFTTPLPPEPTCMIMLSPTVQYSNRSSSHPQSIAIGTFNNDRLMDIVIANTGTDNVGVFLGNGNSTFTSQMVYSTGLGSAPRMVAVDDFNNDNRLDIVVANFGTNNIGILLGNGDGRFQNQTIIPTASSRPLYIVIDDFNNDMQFDIVFTGYGTNIIGVLLGLGNGNFTIQTTFFAGYDSLPYFIAVGDFNSDDKLDIAVANFGTNNVGILLGYGNGTFAIQTTYMTGTNTHPYSIAVANLNNDTHLDIAIVNSETNNLGILFGYGNGSFTLPTFYSTGINSKPIFIAIADFNKDNTSDIAVANNGSDSVGVLFGYGNGTFANQITYSTGSSSSPYSIAIADFNNDGQLDIATVNQQSNNIMIFNGYIKTTFANQITYRTNTSPYPTGVNSYPHSVTVGDFNNDSRLDIVVANSGADNVGVFLGYSDGTFGRQTTYSTGDNSEPTSVVINDFNNDSRLDIAVANRGTNNVGILLGYGDGNFSSQMIYSTGVLSSPVSLTVGDFNNDSRLDIAVVNGGTNNVGVLLAYGDGTFASQMTYSTGSNSQPKCVTVGDFNNDSRLDIAVVSKGTSTLGILIGYGDGTFRDQMTFATGVFAYPQTLVVSDFNNDGNLDIAIANSAGLEKHILILLGDGNGNFSSKGKYDTGLDSNPSSVVIGNFNNDTQLDIAVANGDSNNIGIFLGYGDGTFSNQITYSTNSGSDPISIAIGDFNDDNRTDVVVANYETSTVGIFLAFSYTNFAKATTSFTGSAAHPRAIAVGDFTNNGQLDVAVANYDTHSIDVLFNYGNRSFVLQTVYSGGFTFYPESIVVSDFNSDHQLDIAVANPVADNIDVFLGEQNGTFGNHMTYSAGIGSNSESIAIGDFNNDYRPDIVVAQSGTGSVGVLLRGDNGAVESVKLFPTGSGSKPHGLAVGDFDNDGRLDIAVANNGNANIGLFFGFGNGTFSSQSIISLGEGSYPIWVGVSDFNNDMRVDIVVADNVSPAGILVLLGNGNGSFEIKRTYNVPDEPSACAIGDFNGDGRLDLVVSQSYSSTITILLGHGDGTFENKVTYSTGGSFYSPSVVVGDFNSDGRLDIVVANHYTDSVGVLLGYGDGTFRDQMTYSTGNSSTPHSVAVGDFNKDNCSDIAVTNSGTDNVGVLLGNCNGTFRDQMTYPTGIGSYPYGIVIGDFNNDSRLDIAVGSYGSGNVSILLGYVNGTFFNAITYVTGDNSNPHSVAIGDFNNDGRLDVVVTAMGSDNIGVYFGYVTEGFLSTKAYPIGNASHPVSIAVGDFNNDTYLDVVVADQKSNEVILLYGSGYGTFSSQASYSTGDGSYPSWVAVGDFNQDHQLDIVVVNFGTNNIGVLLGYGNGTFSSPMTYSTGDMSSPQSLAVGNFDTDTHLDIAVAVFGSNTVGLLLGYGNGSFASPLFFTPGFDSHPYAVAFGDLIKDNSSDIVVCNNGYSTIEILSKIC